MQGRWHSRLSVRRLPSAEQDIDITWQRLCENQALHKKIGVSSMSFSRPVVISSAIACVLTLGVLAGQVTTEPSALEKRIQRIQNGLLPAVLVKGEPGAKLTDRMAALRVPGVSIAVIH